MGWLDCTWPGDVVDHQRAHSTSVVSLCDCTVALLACSVPNLCLNCAAVHLKDDTPLFLQLAATGIKKLLGSSLQGREPRCSPQRACMLRVANSTPIVDLDSLSNSLRQKRPNRPDLPTPESPMSTSLNR